MMVERKLAGREVQIGVLAVFVSLAVLTAVSNANGAFYDDEIFSIKLIQLGGSLRGVWALANSFDVHPPLGYALDVALFKLSGSFKSVQLVVGLVNAVALAFMAKLAAQSLDRRTWWTLCALLGTDASAVMWGASLRWYGWFNPIFTCALAVILWGRIGAFTGAVLVGLTGLALFHIGYLAVIVAPLLGLVWTWRFRVGIDRATLVRSGAAIAIAGALCLPQLVVLLRVHLPYPVANSGPLPIALAQTLHEVLIGSAVFPIGVLPAAAALVLAFALASLAWQRSWVNRAWLAPLALLVMGAALLMALSGIGYRPRNALFAHLAALPLMAAGLARLPSPWRLAALIAVGTFQLEGVANVALHQHTDKRSFNTPYPAMLSTIALLSSTCRRTVIAHDDVVLDALLSRRTPQYGLRSRAAQTLAAGDCVIVETGSVQVLDPAARAQALAALARLPVRAEPPRVFGREPGMPVAAQLLHLSIEPENATLTRWRMTHAATLPAIVGYVPQS